MCTARYEVPDLDAAWLALSAELDGDGEVLHHVVDVPGSQTLVRGTVRRADDRIVVETMALERLRKLQALVLEIVPDARLVDESTRSAADAFAETGPDMPPQDAAPELAAEDIAALVRQHEDRWLSERIPALGGLTPREAAANPAAREELVALLDDFEWQDRQTPNAFSMDVHRIRSRAGPELIRDTAVPFVVRDRPMTLRGSGPATRGSVREAPRRAGPSTEIHLSVLEVTQHRAATDSSVQAIEHATRGPGQERRYDREDATLFLDRRESDTGR